MTRRARALMAISLGVLALFLVSRSDVIQ